MSWYFTMALRDSRRQPGRLLLFISSIVLGIAAMVAINTFVENVQNDISSEAKELLGADMVVSNNKKLPPAIDQILDSLAIESAKELKFNSMLRVLKNDGTRLVNVVGSDGDFPFYGRIETTPDAAHTSYLNSNECLVDRTLMIQFDLKEGDSIQLGNVRFAIAGQIDKAPGQTGFTSAVAPAVYIPMDWVAKTGLIKFGSRLSEYRYARITDAQLLASTNELLSKRFENTTIGIQSFEDRSQRTGDAFGDAGKFLNLVAFIALLLGCIGIASTVNIYLKSKFKDIAVLACIGIPARKAFRIYLIQVFFLGFIGALIGAILGSALAYFLPIVLSEFLPVEVHYVISFPAILFGIAVGMVASMLFTLRTLFKLANASPLMALRSFIDDIALKPWQSFLAVSGMILFIILFGLYLLGTLQNALIFTFSCALAIGVLSGIAMLLRFTAKKLLRPGWAFTLRQAIAGLYRPNNQSAILMSTIGLGTTLISLLFLTQDMLLSKVSFQSNDDDPNMIVFDIQTPQLQEVKTFVQDQNMPHKATVPIVTMRLQSLRELPKSHYFPVDAPDDFEPEVESHVFNREWRVTFRDSLIESETLVKGNWEGTYSGEGPVPISVEERTMQFMNASIGDELVFNVQGTDVACRISSVRKVNWNQIQTNFTLLFPNNILEKAPQSHVIITRASSPEQSALFQRELISRFPTLSIVDLNYIIETVTEVINKLKFVITFMSLFSILTGFVVLIASISNSRFQRIKETVLLKTLGAQRKQLISISLLEHVFIGFFAALTGVLLSLAGAYALSIYLFEAIFVPDVLSLAATLLGVTAIVVLIGYVNTRSIATQTPLEVLRKEV